MEERERSASLRAWSGFDRGGRFVGLPAPIFGRRLLGDTQVLQAHPLLQGSLEPGGTVAAAGPGAVGIGRVAVLDGDRSTGGGAALALLLAAELGEVRVEADGGGETTGLFEGLAGTGEAAFLQNPVGGFRDRDELLVGELGEGLDIHFSLSPSGHFPFRKRI